MTASPPTAVARSGALAILAQADACGQQLDREGIAPATYFGPTNVGIHRVAVEVGDVNAALRSVDSVDLSRLPRHLAERRSRYLIDVARACAGEQEEAAAFGWAS